MNKLINSLGMLMVVLFLSTYAYAQVLKDPRMRDEDISGTIVSVKVTLLPSGLYEYVYDVTSPETNKGRILDFGIDIACSQNFGAFAYPEPPAPYFSGDFSGDGKHIPIQAYGVKGFTGLMSISKDNKIGWLVAMDPGDIAKGFRIISPAPPGPRTYKLFPSMDTEGWDYDTYEEDPDVPWTPDFTVYGTITGPSCLLTPPTEPPADRYAGNGHESAEINDLLTYSAPLRDRFHVSDGTTVYAMTLHYGKNIDPKSFKVAPGKLRDLFNPVAGTSETVQLPLSKKKNKFKLKVRLVKSKDKADDDIDKDDKKKGKGKTKDKDTFEIRVDKVPGKAKDDAD
ncbi:hypothetical protein JYT31_03155 [Beggiatoa alba]|nr:hypothetical protein [Beggiatoa alba]